MQPETADDGAAQLDSGGDAIAVFRCIFSVTLKWSFDDGLCIFPNIFLYRFMTPDKRFSCVSQSHIDPPVPKEWRDFVLTARLDFY